MKPVKLEMFLEDGLTPGLKNAGKTVERFTNSTKKQLREVNEQVKIQKKVIGDLEKECAKLEKALKTTAPGKEWAKSQGQLVALRGELEAEKKGLQELTAEQDRLKSESENTGQSLRQQLRSTREEIATLLLAYRSLSDEEKQTAQGRELARHIDELTEKAGVLSDAMADTTDAVKNAASDSRRFDQIAGGVQLVVDSFGLATAGANAFGLSQEDLIEVQTRLQTALVASNALTSMQVNLQKQSALMQGVNVIQTKAAAAAETIRAWAVGRGVIATKAASIAQAAFNAVAKANPYVLLAMAVGTVVGALFAFSKGSAAAKKAEEERQARMEKAKQEEDDYRKAVVDAAGSQIASYLRLKRSWENLGDSLDKKKKFITDTKEEWRKLGKEINNVNDMEKIFSSGTKNMIDAIMMRAQITAYEKRIQAVADDMAEEIEKNSTYTYTKVKAGDISASGQGMGPSGYTESQKITPEERAAAVGHITTEHSKFGGQSFTKIDEAGARIINDMRKKKANDAAWNRQETAREKGKKKISGYVDTIQTLTDELTNTMSLLPGETIDTNDSSKNTNKTDTSSANDRLEAARKTAEDLLKLRKENDQNEINLMAEGAERRRRQIALDFEKEQAEIEAKRKEFAEANKDAGTTGVNENGLTEDQQKEIDRANEIAVKNRDQALDEMYRSEAQHMAEYIKEYGSYQERRLAIAEEYDRKIAEAGDEWEKKRLEKEKAGAMAAVEVEAIKQSVDWGSVFGDFGQLFKEQIRPTVEKLRKIAASDEFKRADIKEREALYELVTKLETAGAQWDSDIFKKIGDDLTAYQTAMRQYIAAQDDERRAAEALATAKQRLAAAEASGDAFATAAARRSVTVATNALAAAGEKTREFGAQVQDASGALQSTTATMNNMFTGLVSGISGLKSGNLQGVGEALMGLDKLLNNGKVTSAVGGALAKGLSKLLGNSTIGKSVAAALGNSGLLGQIISAILSLLDILKDGMGVLVSGVIDTVMGAVSGIIKNMLNGKMYMQIGQSLIDGISGILDAVTFGGFTSWFDTSNAKEVQETIDRLSERNATLQTAIEDLTDEIKSGRGTKSVAAYSDAYRYQEEANANYREMAQAQAGYHGAHHSWEYYFEGFTEEQIAKLSRQIGRAWDGDLWSLTPEEMKLLRSNVDMWERIRDAGKGGYGDRLVEKLDDYIAQAGKLEELTGQLYEGLTGISFDSMYDSFVDQLMDMEATAEDFADNVSEYFMRAMLSNKVGELYADKLEDWWKNFGEAMKDNELSEAERNALSEEYMDYVREAMKLRDDLAAATGYDKAEDKGSSQSGKAGSFAAMSQDQGTKLEGLFVSVQGHVSHIDTKVENVADKLAMAEGHLAKIEEHTGASAGLLDDIKTLMEVIKRDGLKTR